MKLKVPNFDKRVAAPPVPQYSPGVRIGNWFEDECKYEKQKHKHRSTYDVNFINRKMVPIDYNEVWKQRYRAQGIDARILMFDSFEYVDNYATIYDLAYRHFKKDLKGPIPKKKRIEYIESFGNITQYTDTLRRKLCKDWECEKYAPINSEYLREYLPPKPKDYVKSPFGIPSENSTKLFTINKDQLKANKKYKFVIPTDYTKFPPPPRKERRFEFC